jgi:Xaa-Pro aminopeptidase
VRASVRATEHAVGRMRAAIRPGLSENELWSVLHQGVIALGGDYVETRLLPPGTRTKPWFQETGERRLEEDELVALDTLYHAIDFEGSGYDGVLEPGMTVCVESYSGEEGGHEGVKLEQQLLITESGQELLSRFPFEDARLA